MELEAESGDFHTQIPDRALNVYFPRTPFLDHYREGIVEAGFDDRLRLVLAVRERHPHAWCRVRSPRSFFLECHLWFSAFSAPSSLDRPQNAKKTIFASHANQQYWLAISRALAAMHSARLAGAMTFTLGPQLKIHD